MWYRLAHELGMSVQRTKRETTSLEFTKWRRYFRQDANTFHREDFYWAQIALEVRRVLHSNPKLLELKQFLLTFETKKADNTKTATPDHQQRMERSKRAWCALVGIKVPSGN